MHISRFTGRIQIRLLTGAIALLTTAAAGAAAPNYVQQVPLTPLKVQQNAAAAAAAVHQGIPGGRNQRIRPASSRDKITPDAERSGTDVYIVRLHDLPVATYDGRVRGFAATKDLLRHRVGEQNKSTQTLTNYRKYLQSRQTDLQKLLRAKGITAGVRQQFTDSLNAFTMTLTQAEARKIAALPQVEFVQRSELRPLQTDRGPEFIGAQAVWQGGTYLNTPFQGEGIVVGMLDSGINTGHPSFAAVGGDGYTVKNPLGAGHYLGDCTTGAATCNNKLIGVWSWPVITDTYQGIRPASGEDYNGHGSHTSSTAAGNVVKNAPLLGSVLGDGHGTPTGFTFAQVSGVAPHANIIAYQVCLPTGGCPDEAVLLAVDQAIQDGVDVINFSIGGAERFPWTDALALSFLSARAAGIALAAAAGNAGPDFYTLSHSAPWYLPVAASTDDRVLDIPQKVLTLSGGKGTPPDFPTQSYTEYGGISQYGMTGNLIDATTAGDNLCANPFAAGTFTSTEIVVCLRGSVARLAKATNVMAGGAGGFVLVNAGYPADDDDLNNDVYPLPGVQLHSWDGQALLAWMAGGSKPKMSISATTITRSLDASVGDQLADFSSRGPSSTYQGSLAPGISAPGVDIFAAFADEHPFDDPDAALSRDWAIESGTSMASPHVTGSMALIRQAHPDWTPAEVQSALQMTASQTVVFGSPPQPAGIYRAGSGRVDVLAAVNAGLVMDESAANFSFANPENGGNVLQLNLPQVVDSHCRDVCTWVRTVTATRDSTWTANVGQFMFDNGSGLIQINGAKLEVIPATFTLHAGESKSLLLRADLTDAQYQYDGVTYTSLSEQVEMWNQVTFTPSNSAIPAAHWPVSINFDHGVLPKTLDVTAHRDQGSYHLSNVALPAMASTSYGTYGLTVPTVQDIALNQDIDHVPPPYDGDCSHNNCKTILVNVPAGSARLVSEVLKNVATTADVGWKAGWATIWLGIDSNNNGVPDFDDETLCVSNSEVELNYCDISNPDPGTYWIFIANDRTGLTDDDPTDPLDTYRVATAAVPGTGGGGLQIAGPSSTTGVPVGLDVNYSLPAMATDDVVYGAFDVGQGNAPGSVGFVPLKITRGADDVSMTVSQTTARPGDILDVSVHVRENDSGADRGFDLKSILPAGLTLVPGSATVNTAAQRSNLSVSGNTLEIAGTQIDSENWPRQYNVTTSDGDALCRTPIFSANGQSSSGGFVGLVNTLGLVPEFGGHADQYATDSVTVPLSNFWEGGYALYNNASFLAYPSLQISPQGWIIMEPDFGYTMYIHQKFPYLTFPYTPMIGVLWKGVADGGIFSTAIDALGTPLNVDFFDPTQMSGMVVAYASDSSDLIFEWVGARTEHLDLNTGALTELDDHYDFDFLVNRDYRYGDGQYEMIMTYDNLNFGTQGGLGSIGVQGYSGPLSTFGDPYFGDLWSSYAYNDLQTKLHNNIVVCYDYQGPESTQFDLTFQVRASELYAGTDQVLHWNSHIDGMTDRSIDATIHINGTIMLPAMSDMTTVENTPVLGIPVIYNDNDATPDTVSVSGAHVTAVVHGNAPGDTFDLVPDAGFTGSTTITVTVSDQANPADQASTTFTLTVIPDAIFGDGFE